MIRRRLLSLFLIALAFASGSLCPITLAQDASPEDAPQQLASPRATMRTFLVHVNKDDLTAATACLDFSQETLSNAEQEQLANQLKAIMDRMAWVDFAKIPDHHSGSAYKFPPNADDQPIVINQMGDGTWRFTAETVTRIGQLYEAYKDQPRIVTEKPPWYRQMTPIGSEIWRIAALFLSILLSWIVGRVIRWLLLRTGKTMEQRGRQYATVLSEALSRASVPLLLVVGLQIGLSFLVLNDIVQEIADTTLSVLFALALGYAVWCLIDVVNVWISRFSAKTESKLDDMLAPMIQTSLRVTVVILILVQVATILSNKPMTSVIAGLGVGGLAIGLAAQDMIKNFFGSIMIFSDRPFEMGERIQAGSFDGTVETVGFRSTRLRTPDGHLVTMPNGELANMSIRNVAKRPNIRRVMNLGVTYDTSVEKLREAIEIVQDVLHDHEGQNPDLPPRVFFNEFNDSALNLFVIYWYHPAEWWKYCEFSQRVNMEILQRFNEAHIEFAFPSQTVYLAGQTTADTSDAV
ncbi:MAG: mechanosensitive ion channel family protein [Pirellulaceae bacterium]|nr:mechanosensitive ion channel family protein [Pirellulaceae bacterium]